MIAQLDDTKFYLNTGQPSATSGDVLASAPTRIYPHIACGIPSDISIYLGTNDLELGVPPATTWSNILALATGCKANGGGRITIVTPTPLTGHNSQRDVLVGLIQGGWVSSGVIDAIADTSTQPFGVDGAEADTAFFVDGIHENDTGIEQLFQLNAPQMFPSATLPPLGPISLRLTPSSGNIDLSWTAPASGSPSGYDIESSPDPTLISNGLPVSFVWTRLATNHAGTTYVDTPGAGISWYRIRSVVSGVPSHWTINGSAANFILQDSFADTNGADLTAHTIAPINDPATAWVGSGITIESNQAVCAGNAVTVCDAGKSDFTIKCSLTGDTTNTGPSIVFRYVDANNFWFVQLGSMISIQLYEVIAGTATQRGQVLFSYPLSTLVNVTIVCSGTSITVTEPVSGANMTWTSSDLETATKVGLRALSFGGNCIWSEFAVA